MKKTMKAQIEIAELVQKVVAESDQISAMIEDDNPESEVAKAFKSMYLWKTPSEVL